MNAHRALNGPCLGGPFSTIGRAAENSPISFNGAFPVLNGPFLP